MIFGSAVLPATTTEAAEWIERSRSGAGTVGSLVPNQHEACLKVQAPSPDVEDWWAEYRALFEVIATVATDRTSTPLRAWFAVWEGHGFVNARTFVARSGALSRRDRRRLEQEQARLRAEDEHRDALTRSALNQVPRIALPHRTYYLLSGPVSAAVELTTPGNPERWCRPDLWWPDDRRWFVATDVDFWSVFVAGDSAFTADVASAVSTPSNPVSLRDVLGSED